MTVPHSLVIAGLMLGAYSKVTQVRQFLQEERRRIPWWAVGMAAIVVGGLVAIAGYFYGSGQPSTVVAEGRMDATSAKVVATTPGQVSLLTVEEGSSIERGEVAAWVKNADDGSLDQLIAPASGQITSLEVGQGENVVIGDVLAEIYQTDSMVASSEVDENSIQRVAIGQRVIVTSGSLDLETTARVLCIALTPLPPDPTVSERTRKIRKYIVKCQLDQPDPRLLIGMAVKARIFTDSGY